MKKILFFSLILLLALSACGEIPSTRSTQSVPTQPAAPEATPPAAATPSEPAETASTEPAEAAFTEPVEPAPVAISCTAPAALTPSSTEGPYYSPNPPEDSNLADDLPGTRLLLTGYVLDPNCRPIPGARVDFWQADSQGVYDNAGYTLRGYQLTAADGSYRLETVIPGQYPGRTEHIHVKVQAPGGPELTSQLYFPKSTANRSDRIFVPELLVEIVSEDGGQVTARFDFVVQP